MSRTRKKVDDLLPVQFLQWFSARNWRLRDHQLELCRLSRSRKSALLIAPTGAGKTLAGFLPSLIDLANKGNSCNAKQNGPHTLYISPLKALAVDVARNLQAPIDDMGLPSSLVGETARKPFTMTKSEIRSDGWLRQYFAD